MKLQVAIIGAGVLEQATVDLLRASGLAERTDLEGHRHDRMKIVWAGRESSLIDVARHVGKHFMNYGQSSIQEDLVAVTDRRHATVQTEVTDVQPAEVTSNHPSVRLCTRVRSFASSAISSPAATASIVFRERRSR